jgi:tetracycline 7-halogenase / FADH2 O2-dependent halogenase
LFSTGIPLTLLGIERMAQAIETRGLRPALDIADIALAEADHTARFIAGCYAAFPHFDAFTAYSMFYFAAASFSEMQRRLTPERASAGFLRAADEAYASAMRQLSPAENPPAADFCARVADATAPINVAGLCNPALRNWYPVDLEDTIRAAHKFELTPGRVRDALEFANVTSTPNVSGNRGDRSPDVSSGARLGR